jgi:hypothetical protein
MRFDFYDRSFVHVSIRDQPGRDEFAEPCGSFGIMFVVVVHALEKEEMEQGGGWNGD